MSSKDFLAIEDDYAFFMNSATEAQQDGQAHLEELRERFTDSMLVSWLDIGCGRGEFTKALLETWKWPANNLSLNLLEPVEKHRTTAVEALSGFSKRTPRQVLDLYTEKESQYDVVLANHSCYYVDDAGKTAAKIARLLRPTGLAIIAIAGIDNFLIELWRLGFESIGKNIPYWVAEDYEKEMRMQRIDFHQKTVPYELRFPDTTENRDRITRFLFGTFWEKMNTDWLRQYFDPFRVGQEVLVETHSKHFLIASSQP